LGSWKQSIAKCTEYSQLPVNAQNYLKKLEELTGIQISWIGVGPEREAMIHVQGKDKL